MKEPRTVLVVLLFLHEGRETEFDDFEKQAARIMERHGGRVERAIRPTNLLHGGSLPHEIHIVTFADLAHFEAYRSDPSLLALAPLRESAISRTEIVVGRDVT